MTILEEKNREDAEASAHVATPANRDGDTERADSRGSRGWTRVDAAATAVILAPPLATTLSGSPTTLNQPRKFTMTSTDTVSTVNDSSVGPTREVSAHSSTLLLQDSSLAESDVDTPAAPSPTPPAPQVPILSAMSLAHSPQPQSTQQHVVVLEISATFTDLSNIDLEQQLFLRLQTPQFVAVTKKAIPQKFGGLAASATSLPHRFCEQNSESRGFFRRLHSAVTNGRCSGDVQSFACAKWYGSWLIPISENPLKSSTLPAPTPPTTTLMMDLTVLRKFSMGKVIASTSVVLGAVAPNEVAQQHAFFPFGFLTVTFKAPTVSPTPLGAASSRWKHQRNTLPNPLSTLSIRLHEPFSDASSPRVAHPSQDTGGNGQSDNFITTTFSTSSATEMVTEKIPNPASPAQAAQTPRSRIKMTGCLRFLPWHCCWPTASVTSPSHFLGSRCLSPIPGTTTTRSGEADSRVLDVRSAESL